MTTPTPQPSSDKIHFSCHCGLIRLSVPRQPPPVYINECMCSICRRYAAAWAYYPLSSVTINAKGPTRAYRWGDRILDFVSCEACACLVYWYPAAGVTKDGEAQDEMGVNTRCVDELDDLKFVDRKIEWGTARMVREGVYDEKGRGEGKREHAVG